mmetsp:Transcript_55038/g.128755  ORF Transcript_55038/g.128755 Transcript_55038/m.128755 type:complete len:422 (+) Transcript_55038:116-1381(+)
MLTAGPMVQQRISVKNTFISCEPECTVILDLGRSPFQSASPRARSAECMSPRRSDGEQSQQIERLNKVWESELSPREALSPLPSSLTGSPSAAEARSPRQSELRSKQAPSAEELKELKQKLQQLCDKQCGYSGLDEANLQSLKPSPFGFHNVPSYASLSSMGDDACSDSDLPRGMNRDRFSTNSVSTMASAQVDMEQDDGEVEFDLTIEEPTTVDRAATTGKRNSNTSDDGGSSPSVRGSSKKSATNGAHPAVKDYKHCNVPKTVNLKDEYGKLSQESPPTTLMIRNIPNRYTQRELIAELEELGFTGTFDFLYVPLDKGTMSNVGYAFVNFIDALWAKKCFEEFQNHRFKQHRRVSSKVAAVSVAHIQGLEANLAHYKNAAVNSAKMKQLRPVIMANISKVLGQNSLQDEDEADVIADTA